jgi:hypothetical protein
MWETLDFRDYTLVRFAQRDLWREAARERLARELRTSRRSVIGSLAARISRSNRPSDVAT